MFILSLEAAFTEARTDLSLQRNPGWLTRCPSGDDQRLESLMARAAHVASEWKEEFLQLRKPL